jgi:hypothetical protein
VHVRVDDAGEERLAGGEDDVARGVDGRVPVEDGDDAAVAHGDGGRPGAVGQHDPVRPDDEVELIRHARLPGPPRSGRRGC